MRRGEAGRRGRRGRPGSDRRAGPRGRTTPPGSAAGHRRGRVYVSAAGQVVRPRRACSSSGTRAPRSGVRRRCPERLRAAGGGEAAPGTAPRLLPGAQHLRGILCAGEREAAPGDGGGIAPGGGGGTAPGGGGGIAPGMEGGCVPSVKLRPGASTPSPGRKGTLRPRMRGHCAPGGGCAPRRRACAGNRPVPCSGVALLLQMRCAPDKAAPGTASAYPSGGHGVRAGCSTLRRPEAGRGRPRVLSRGRGVSVGCPEPPASRGGEVPAGTQRLERFGTVWGAWGLEVPSDVLGSAVGKLPVVTGSEEVSERAVDA